MIRRIIFLTVVIIMLHSATTVSAHPGKTDSNGGHYCRTNCESYGLKYGEYHYHGVNNVEHVENHSSNDGFVTFIIVLSGIVLYLTFLIWSNRSYKETRVKRFEIKNGKPVIEVETQRKLIPPDEEVEIEGFILTTRYRKNGFFVCTFMSLDHSTHTIVGEYHGRLYKDKPYKITGTKTYHHRYGLQIKVKTIERSTS